MSMYSNPYTYTETYQGRIYNTVCEQKQNL